MIVVCGMCMMCGVWLVRVEWQRNCWHVSPQVIHSSAIRTMPSHLWYANVDAVILNRLLPTVGNLRRSVLLRGSLQAHLSMISAGWKCVALDEKTEQKQYSDLGMVPTNGMRLPTNIALCIR